MNHSTRLMNATKGIFLCTTSPRGSYRATCDKVATEALVETRGYLGQNGREVVYKPLCRTHAGAQRRRQYVTPTIVPIDAYIAAILLATYEAAASREAAEAVVTHAKRAEALEASRKAAHAEALVPYVALVTQDDPRYGEAVGETKYVVKPAGNPDRTWDTAEVKVTRRDASWPVTVEVRNNSHMTLNQAIALCDALSFAIADAQKAD